jgi:hypothetical protein
MVIEQGNPYAAGAPEVLRLGWDDFRFEVSAVNRAAMGHRAKWTVLLYLAADCDLARWMFDDLLEAKSVGSTADVNVLVFFDGPLLGDSFMARLHAGTALGEDLIVRFFELDMADPASLVMALQLAQAFPAEHRLTVLGGHGAGWQGGLLDQGLGLRYTRDPGRLVLPAPFAQCQAELRRCQQVAQDLINDDAVRPPEGSDAHLDVLAFDACYMGNLEAVGGLAERAHWMVLSEDQWPGDGFDYRALLRTLHDDPAITPEALVRGWVAHAGRVMRHRGPETAPVTLAAIDASRLAPLGDAFVRFAQCIDARDAAVLGHFDAALMHTWTSPFTGLTDLKGLAQNLMARPVPAACAEAARLLVQRFDEAVVAFAGDGTPAGPNGVSVYAPPPEQFDSRYIAHANTLPFGLGVWAWALGGYYLHVLGGDAAAHPLIASLQATMQAAVRAGDWRPS